MNWFEKLCRSSGRFVGQLTKPPPRRGGPQRREVNRRVEEERVKPDLTFRRTTIEEVEVKREEDRGTG